MQSVADDLLRDVLDLAKEYQIDHIKTRCEQYISSRLAIVSVRRLSSEQLLIYLSACDEHGLENLREKLMKLASEMTYNELENGRRSRSYAASAVLDVFRSRCKELENKRIDLRSGILNLCSSIKSMQPSVSDSGLRKKVTDELSRLEQLT